MTEAVALDPRDIAILQEIARGLTNDQIAVKWFLTRGEVDNKIKSVYRKMLVFEKGLKSRAFALAKAVREFGLEPPEELAGPIEMLVSGQVTFDETDLMILKLVAEGKSLPAMESALGLRHQDISLRLAGMRLRTGLTLIRPFCVAAVAIWAHLMEHLELDNERPLTPAEVDLMYDVILGITAYDTGVRLGINVGAAKARIRALVLRLGVRTEAQAAELCIRKNWLPVPTPAYIEEAKRIVDAVGIVTNEGLSAYEVEAVKLLATGKTRPEISDAMGGEMTHPRLNAILDRLYGRLDVDSASAVVAVVAWAGWPEPTLPEHYYRKRPGPGERPDPRLITTDDVELLVLLARGLTVDEIGQELSRSTGRTVRPEPFLGALYRKLGAVNGYNAVGMATRDGLLDTYFETQDLESVRAGMFTRLYVRALQMQASGVAVQRNAGLLGVSERSFVRHTKPDRDLGIQTAVAIAFLTRRDEITASGKSLTPLIAESAASGLLAAWVPVASPVAVADAADDSADATPAPPPTPSDSGSPRPDPVVTKAINMAAGNRTNKEVMNGAFALSKNLGQHIGSHFVVIMAAIRAGEIPAPWIHSVIVTRVRERELSTQVELFLLRIAEGVPLEEVRTELNVLIPEAVEPQEFRKWYMRYVCGLLGARGPREAAAIALWLELIELTS